MSAEFYDGGIAPRVWASKFQGLPLDQWAEMFALVPRSLQGIVTTHLNITMERKGVSEQKRNRIIGTVLAVATIVEQPVQAKVDEERGRGVDDDGQGQSLQAGSGLHGQGSDDQKGDSNNDVPSVLDDGVASARPKKKGRVKPAKDSGGQLQQDSLF